MYTLLRVLPKNVLSRCTGWAVNVHLPDALRLWSLRWFARHYRLNLDEAAMPLTAYRCIGELFTRQLKPGARYVDHAATAVHPVDGRLTQWGRIVDGTLMQAKGLDYTLTELVTDPQLSERLRGGGYWTYYLCPTDYHRVHSPVEGDIDHAVHVPGTLWPVNEWSVSRIDRLFTINERLVIAIQSTHGLCVVVMVGATNVGMMSVGFDPQLVSNQSGVTTQQARHYTPSMQIQKGDELGIFHMGSTVIVLYEHAQQLAHTESGPHAVTWGSKLF
ncbi:MAG: archaetidylserine decarboxylase [bacterium]|nr:archaetidylserine decarboxylase [bacterium]